MSSINYETGDNCHLGHVILDCFRQRSPDAVCQIDAETGEEETYSSVLSRSIRLARSFIRLGLQPGDVLILGGRNHLDSRIVYYAALLCGLPIAGMDPYYKYDEIKNFFEWTQAKIAFCQPDTYSTFCKAAKDSNIEAKIFSFGGGEQTIPKLLETHIDDEPEDQFQPAVFDLDKVYAWLVSTSGTTGVPKLVAIKHTAILKPVMMMFRNLTSDDKSTRKVAINVSPVQWMSAYMQILTMPLNDIIQLQTNVDSIEYVIDVINKYKPTLAIVSPSLMHLIVNNDKKCDLTCFNQIMIGGGKVYKDMLLELKGRVGKEATVVEAYGGTENLGVVTIVADPHKPIGSCGKVSPQHTLKLVVPETGKEITEAYKTGELWTKGPRFTEYYKNPEETANAFTEDGWLKTGDLLYRDENGYYYFVERIKMLLKYRNYHIVPTELEEVIRSHPGVLDVGVTGILDRQDGQHPVACVVRRAGCDVTAQEIKDLVANKLSDNKQLRGGVVFLDELPLTSTGKVARAQLKNIVLTAHRE